LGKSTFRDGNECDTSGLEVSRGGGEVDAREVRRAVWDDPLGNSDKSIWETKGKTENKTRI